MSIIQLLVFAVVVCIAAYALSVAKIPQPLAWIGWGVLLVAVLAVVLRVAGIPIG